ncbi:hypothetical protein E5K00_19380 [Hymenobacter aquaticus]|uniref:DUF6438 domain-containing protein n=1 Tax=Hymenobacter aquaticus TaxID=1867101 RepID=A0A4Z0PYL0_9BACT|nr:DUF6438 domain-containing protein [Hymenobacter aquaticus]TGE22404.1 hypothetical protein E5K00_19380 [Hymenobacter aquaticus]
MRPSAFLLVAGLLWAGSLSAQNLLSDRTKTKIVSREPTKIKLVTKKPAASAVAAKKVDSAPVFVFKRTPCFGTCPHYEATVYADGRVSYTGYGYVKRTGTHEFRLPQNVVNTVLDDARRLNFSTYEERYSQGSTDLPATVLSIRQPNGQLKTVQAEEGTPPELDSLLKYISTEIEKVSGGVTTPAKQ